MRSLRDMGRPLSIRPGGVNSEQPTRGAAGRGQRQTRVRGYKAQNRACCNPLLICDLQKCHLEGVTLAGGNEPVSGSTVRHHLARSRVVTTTVRFVFLAGSTPLSQGRTYCNSISASPGLSALNFQTSLPGAPVILDFGLTNSLVTSATHVPVTGFASFHW
jgi:hypothetical protein